MTEDIAIISSKSDVDPCSHDRETYRQKVRMDGQTAFQLYIVDALVLQYQCNIHEILSFQLCRGCTRLTIYMYLFYHINKRYLQHPRGADTNTYQL